MKSRREARIRVVHEYHTSDDGRHRIVIHIDDNSEEPGRNVYGGDWVPFDKLAMVNIPEEFEPGLFMMATSFFAGTNIIPDTLYCAQPIEVVSTTVINPIGRPRA